jgi:hypothetical protein
LATIVTIRITAATVSIGSRLIAAGLLPGYLWSSPS